MKSIFYRKLLGLILLAAGWSAIHGANTMTISSTSMGPNQNFSVMVDISNSNSFVAFQFDLPIPAGFSYIAGSAALSPLRINGHLLDASIIPGNKLRVVGYSNSNVPFVGNSGTVVSFQLKAGVVPGSYPLALTAPVIGDTNSVNILTGSTNGTATLLAPDIHITTSLLDFIRTPLGSYTDKTLTISNTGNQPLTITGITFTSSYFTVVGNSTFAIAAGQSQNVQVRFTSLVKGVYDKKMTITCNDPDETSQQVSLHARAYAVNELHTGNIFAYSGKTGTLTFSINNMEPFTGFQFDLVLPAPLTYAAGTASLSGRKANHVVSVNTIPGNKLRVVAHSPTGQVFSGTAGSVLTLSFNVKGIGGGYGLNLQNVIIGDTLGENSLSDSYNGTLTVAAPDISSSSQLSFGNVSILETGQKTLRIYNYGSDTLKIEQISFSNPSYTLGTILPLNVMSSSYKDINVTFHQTTRGQSNGTLKVFSNDPDEYPYIVNLSANAFVPNYIIIPNLSARDIDTISVPVKINNIEQFVGFQVDIDYPSFMTFIQNSASVSARGQGHLVVAQNVTSTRVRVISYSPQQNHFTGDTGTVVTLRFAINAPTQNSASLVLSNGVLGNELSQDILWGTLNGIISIEHPHSLSGTFSYNNSANTPLDSLWVYLKENGDKLDSTRTTLSGTYSFQQVYNGTYTISAKTNKPWGGANGTDGLKIMRHFAGLEVLTIPVRKTSADVNNTQNINGTDAVKVQLRCVGMDSTFERGDWTFEKHGGGDTVIMAGANQVVNFYGLCVGDVNGSHVPGTGAKSTYNIEVVADKLLNTRPGQELFLPVSVSRDMEVGAMSLILEYPEDMIRIEEVTAVQGSMIFKAQSGKLSAVWADLNPIRAAAGEPIAFIKIRTSDQFSPGTKVKFSNASELTEFSDRTGQPIEGLKVSIAGLQYNDGNEDREMYVAPNPAKNYTSVIFRVPEAGTAKLTIYNQKGNVIKSYPEQSVDEGLNKMSLNVTSLNPGEYLLDLEVKCTNSHIRQAGKLIVGF